MGWGGTWPRIGPEIGAGEKRERVNGYDSDGSMWEFMGHMFLPDQLVSARLTQLDIIRGYPGRNALLSLGEIDRVPRGIRLVAFWLFKTRWICRGSARGQNKAGNNCFVHAKEGG